MYDEQGFPGTVSKKSRAFQALLALKLIHFWDGFFNFSLLSLNGREKPLPFLSFCGGKKRI